MLSGKDVNDLIDVDRSTIMFMNVHHCQTQRMQRRTFMLGIACVAGGISVGVLFWRQSRQKSAYKSI